MGQSTSATISTSARRTATFTSSRELHLFWQVLSSAVYDNTAGAECVTLSNSHCWFALGKFGSILLERECYRTLWKIIDAGWHSQAKYQSQSQSESKSKFDARVNIMKSNHDYLVVGTQGIGKTAFLFYVMWKLVTKRNADDTLAIPDLRIVVEIREEPTVRYYFRRATGWTLTGFGSTITVETGGPESFMAQIHDPDVYYLCDGIHPLSEFGGRRTHTLETASLDEQLYSKYENEGGIIKLIMPIWKYTELALARAKLFPSVTAAKLKENYALMGGTIRWVLVKQHFDATLDLK